jgi:hypothetical protein
MGHKRIDETMRYVHVAAEHQRPTPPEVLQAAVGELDPDRRILLMLGARVEVPPAPGGKVIPLVKVRKCARGRRRKDINLHSPTLTPWPVVAT